MRIERSGFRVQNPRRPLVDHDQVFQLHAFIGRETPRRQNKIDDDELKRDPQLDVILDLSVVLPQNGQRMPAPFVIFRLTPHRGHHKTYQHYRISARVWVDEFLPLDLETGRADDLAEGCDHATVVRASRCSNRYIPCHVPNANRPSITGI